MLVFWDDNNGSVSFDAPVDVFVSVGSTIVTVFFGVDDSEKSFSSLDKCSSAELFILWIVVGRDEP